MPNSSANGYQGGNSVGMIGDDFDQFIKVFNTGTALSEGAVYNVDMADDADGYYPKPTAIATDTVGRTLVGVVTTDVTGSAGIAADTWGWMQVRGYCAKVNVNTDVTDENTLKTTNATAYATDEAGATQTAKTFAIAKGAITGAGSIAAVLLGHRVTV